MTPVASTLHEWTRASFELTPDLEAPVHPLRPEQPFAVGRELEIEFGALVFGYHFARGLAPLMFDFGGLEILRPFQPRALVAERNIARGAALKSLRLLGTAGKHHHVQLIAGCARPGDLVFAVHARFSIEAFVLRESADLEAIGRVQVKLERLLVLGGELRVLGFTAQEWRILFELVSGACVKHPAVTSEVARRGRRAVLEGHATILIAFAFINLRMIVTMALAGHVEKTISIERKEDLRAFARLDDRDLGGLLVRLVATRLFSVRFAARDERSNEQELCPQEKFAHIAGPP